MKLRHKKIHNWPKLAWVAVFSNGSETIDIYHGPMVETSDDWCVEAVWAGEFADGDFDQTDLVFGSGVRCRENRVTFVSSGTMMDRLWYYQDAVLYVSNSLPAILAIANLSLLDDYSNYTRDMYLMLQRTRTKVHSIPTESGAVFAVYFDNIAYEGHGLNKISKPEDTTLNFASFDDYYRFMVETAKYLYINYTSSKRAYPVRPLGTISSGYDSPASMLFAKKALCEKAVTIKNAASLWRGSDSGADIAKQIGIDCVSYSLVPRTVRHEKAVWAGVGRPGELNWTQFDFPEPLCLFFTAIHGDAVWDLSHRDLSDPLVRPSFTGLGLCKFRLYKGIFHCVVPFWGIRHAKEIQAISFSEEMKPWILGKRYDRPIARRIIEEAGVKRGTFAVRKKNASGETSFLWPYSSDARVSFERYLRKRGLYVPPPWLLWLIRHAARIDNLFYLNITQKIGMKRSHRPWDGISNSSLLFHWANSELKKEYKSSLKTKDSVPSHTHGGA